MSGVGDMGIEVVQCSYITGILISDGVNAKRRYVPYALGHPVHVQA